jgi:hypothetical protein
MQFQAVRKSRLIKLYKKHQIRLFLLAGIVFLCGTAGQQVVLGEAPGTASVEAPTAGQIVQRMEDRNLDRSERLKHYTSERHYQVEYKGFPATIAASMDVEVTYDAPSSKSFRVVSETGSKLLIDRVLKRLLKTEQDSTNNQSQTALTTANYTFSQVGTEVTDGRPVYILQVEPKADNKLLYRGKIWVDGTDYAVTKIDAEPAQNPSFWIKKTEIHHEYSKTGDFWLPERNQSESKVRIGGNAILTIEYGAYRVDPASMAASPVPQPIPSR